MNQPLSLEHLQHEDGTRIVVVGGDIDTMTAPRFTAAIDELMGSGARHVVVDLARVRFIDSSGLVALMSASNRLRRSAGDLRVASPSETVKRLLALTRMDTVFAVFDSRELAISGHAPPVA